MEYLKLLSDLDLNDKRIGNLVIEKLDKEPKGVVGKIFFDTTVNKLKLFNGLEWVEVSNDKTTKPFVYSQEDSIDVWDIKHDLNKFPSVTIVDSAGSVVVGDIDYVDENNVRVSFSSQFSGKAYLN